jgi:UPF0271 protein
MPYITSANIACGFHAGDPLTMAQTISLARKHKVAPGAHPGFPDLLGFGRRKMHLTSEEAKNYIIYQMGALQGFAKAANANLQHVKPHGALYNMAAEDESLSKSIVAAVKAFDSNLIVFAPPKSELTKTALSSRLRVACEFFADRAYDADGSLASRKQPKSIINDAGRVVERTLRAIGEGTVLAIDGKTVSLGKIHTVCVHGDTPTAVNLVKKLNEALVKANVKVEPVHNFL